MQITVTMSRKEDLKFLVFLAKITYPRYNSYIFIVYMFINYREVLRQQQMFTLRGVTSKFLRNFVQRTVWDIDNTIVISDNTETNSIKNVIINGEVTTRKVNVITRHFDDKNVALLSYNLLYNLKGAVSCGFKKCSNENLEFADEVELSLVNSPCEWSHLAIDFCLKNFFTVPKLINQGDLIAINLEEYGKEVFYSTNKIININEKLYFKCNKITYLGQNVKGGYLCGFGKTSVKQAVNIQSFVPNDNSEMNQELDLEIFCSSALDTYFEEIKKSVLPFVKKSTYYFVFVFIKDFFCR